MASTRKIVHVSTSEYDFMAGRIPSKMPIDPRLETLRHGLVGDIAREFVGILGKIDRKAGLYPGGWHDHKRQVKSREMFANWVIVMITDMRPASPDPDTALDPFLPPTDAIRDRSSHSRELRVELANMFIRSKIADQPDAALDRADSVIDQLIEGVLPKIGDYHRQVTKWISQHADNRSRPVVQVRQAENGEMTFRLADRSAREGRLTKSLYERLRLLWESTVPFSVVRGVPSLFDWTVYALILRYETLDPSSLRQGSLPEEFFLDLNLKYQVNFEIFAGSTNSSSNYYCSLFPDIERLFGSYGNAFDLRPIRGFYQANPPLIELITDEGLGQISEWLEQSDEPLSFIVFTPPWEVEDGADGIVDDYVHRYRGIKVFQERDQLAFTFDPQGYLIQYVQHHDNRNLKPFRAPRISVVQNQAGKAVWPFEEKDPDLTKIILKYLRK